MNENVIYSINGPVVTVKDTNAFSMLEMVYVGNARLIGEVISIKKELTTIQVYETTTGLKPGEPVYGTGQPISVTLGPGILRNIFDGIERPLEEIAKELEVPIEEVAISFDAIQDPISLQEPVYNDGSESIYVMDQVKDRKNTDELWAEKITIKGAMEKLNEKERMIINKRFFDGRTQMEVAEEIGISQAQVSRIEKSAINHIKRLYN